MSNEVLIIGVIILAGFVAMAFFLTRPEGSIDAPASLPTQSDDEKQKKRDNSKPDAPGSILMGGISTGEEIDIEEDDDGDGEPKRARRLSATESTLPPPPLEQPAQEGSVPPDPPKQTSSQDGSIADRGDLVY